MLLTPPAVSPASGDPVSPGAASIRRSQPRRDPTTIVSAASSSPDIEAMGVPPLPPPASARDSGRVARSQRWLLAHPCLLWSSVLGLFLFVSFSLPWAQLLTVFVQWAQSLGNWGYVVFYVAFVLIAFPFTVGYSPLVLAAGYLYGWRGLVVISSGSCTGAYLVFYLARNIYENPCLDEMMNTMRRGQMGALLFALADGGLRGALLARLIPVPIGISNSVLAMTSLSFRDYALSTFVGLLPFQITFCYFGSAMRSLSDVVSGHATLSGGQIAVLILQAMATVTAILYFRRLASQRSAAHLEGVSLSPSSAVGVHAGTTAGEDIEDL